MVDEASVERLRRRLDALPLVEPPDALWSRIVAARAAPRRRTLAFAAAASLTAIALAAAVFLARPQGEPRHVSQVSQVSQVAHVAQARALEAELASVRGARVANPDVLSLERELAVVDVALQSAYDSRAAPHELDALWRARTERLAALLVAYRHAATLVRI